MVKIERKWLMKFLDALQCKTKMCLILIRWWWWWGVGICPQQLWLFAPMSWMASTLSNLHVISIFSVWNHSKKMGGCRKKFLKNFWSIFFSFKNWSNKFRNQIFSKKIIHNSTFRQQIWVQNDFSFHLICILSM